MCLSHLFGFVKGLRGAVTFNTPAFVASSNKKLSTFVSRSSFDIPGFSMMAMKAAVNASVDVYATHILALVQ